MWDFSFSVLGHGIITVGARGGKYVTCLVYNAFLTQIDEVKRWKLCFELSCLDGAKKRKRRKVRTGGIFSFVFRLVFSE